MICLLALIVFGVLGIFSASHRKIAAKAFDCVFRRVTLRPCQSGLDRHLRNSIILLVSKRNVVAGRFVLKHFELLSWIFSVLLIVSLFFSARGLYFLALYGNCNGASDAFCVFDALIPEQSSTCNDPSIIMDIIDIRPPDIGKSPSLGPEDAKVTIIEIGCYSCEYTKKAEPVVREILERYEGRVRFVFKEFPLPSHNDSRERALAAHCANAQGKFWEYHRMLMDRQESYLDSAVLVSIAESLGLDTEDFSLCLDSKEMIEKVNANFREGIAGGIRGTPTFFINDKVIVGPRPFKYFQNVIESELGRE